MRQSGNDRRNQSGREIRTAFMPDESVKKHSQTLSELIATSKRLREESAKLKSEIARLDETIAEEAAALVLKVREREGKK
jgi:hypothetical protein